MATPHSRRSRSKSNVERQKFAKQPSPEIPDHPLEEDPAVERGERIHDGKVISRGGKQTGFVPGATEQPVKNKPKPK